VIVMALVDSSRAQRDHALHWDRALLRSLLAFLAVTTLIGGLGILMDWWGLSPEWLDGSIFPSYTIPGLALIGVGLAALLAGFLSSVDHRFGKPAAVLAGVAIAIYEAVEVLVVPFHWLQVFYVAVGLLIILLAGGIRASRHTGDG
jgi:hypothetical protein